MTTVTFSYLSYASGAEVLALARRYAKKAKALDLVDRPLAFHQDQVAIGVGFNNWSMLHKHLAQKNSGAFGSLLDLMLDKPGLGSFILEHAVRTIDLEYATDTMRAWSRNKYTPLNDFAYIDNEAPNGFAWPNVDVAEVLIAEFIGQFPEELIREVGNDLEVNEGPWGVEAYGEQPDSVQKETFEFLARSI